MEFILGLAIKSIGQVWLTLQHNWPYLAVGVIIAAVLKLYVNAEKVSAFLSRHRKAGVVAATTVAVTTPLCSCGTTAVVLGMMATTMPWAPIVAFMVSSPLTSPEGLVYSAGLFGWPFALAFFLSSIILGLAGGWVASMFERRGWLANQTRYRESVSAPYARASSNKAAVPSSRVFSLDVPSIPLSTLGTACACAAATPVALATSCGCGQAEITLDRVEPGCGCASNPSRAAQGDRQAASQKSTMTPSAFLNELYTGGKRLLFMFLGFAFIGYFLNGLIPASWVSAVFGGGNVYNVPLAATLGLPFYINSEASLPLIRSLLDAGMSHGAALAFLISGAGTSIGAITGALTIARWRVIALAVGVLWIGAIVCGFAFDLALTLKVF